MSLLKSRVGAWKIVWKTTPRGAEGMAQVQVQSGEPMEVRWCRDAHGIWIVLPHGVFGFDIRREWDESGEPLYHVIQRGAQAAWSGVSFIHGEEAPRLANQGAKAKATRVRAQMPGKIIRVMVEPGQVVEKDQPTLVMEAMKMENEIRAPQSGRVTQVKVTEGQTVETGADLLLFEPA